MRIGITQRVLYHKDRAYDSLEQSWYDFLRGHTLIPIPNDPRQDYLAVLKLLDLLIFSGGNSIYEDSPTYSPERQEVEEMLLRYKPRHIPLIGICRGAQLLTKSLKGTLQVDKHHMDTEHDIGMDNDIYTVNSYHNVVIKNPPHACEILAFDMSGHVESWYDVYDNVYAIMWHPERMETPVLPKIVQNLLWQPKDVL